MASNDPGEPESPLTPLAAEAAMHREIYSTYVEVGFSPAEALDLLKTVIVTSLQAHQ